MRVSWETTDTKIEFSSGSWIQVSRFIVALGACPKRDCRTRKSRVVEAGLQKRSESVRIPVQLCEKGCKNNRQTNKQTGKLKKPMAARLGKASWHNEKNTKMDQNFPTRQGSLREVTRR